ncbi:MAG: alanyl-tRNA editing protein [Rhodobacteraceae bacterium]|nr:alanyl-tRNA editing protein [Paracoccaceae bacterium]
MTTPLYLEDAYQTRAEGCVTGITEQGGIILDQSLFYATSGGQPGDNGTLIWDDQDIEITTTIKGEGGSIVLIPAEGAPRPAVGQAVKQDINWDMRYAHMRMHTALHLLSVVIPLPVTGGAITAVKGRLDFDMPEAPDDKDALTEMLNAIIARNFDITERWISDAELDANPGLVKTMSVQPPRGAGRIRLVRIGDVSEQVDLQPCGGTHVAKTGEIGRVAISKVEKKGKQNRRVHLVFQD